MPNVFLIGEGPYPSSSYLEIVGSYVDLAVIGEGEKTFVELIGSLNKNKTLPVNLVGTAVLVDGKIKKNESRPVLENIDELPAPNYDLIDVKDYVGIYNLANLGTDKSAFIESSRGCTYKCYYCHAALSKTVRRRSADLVIEEILTFYSNLYQKPDFDQQRLDQWLNFADQNAKDTVRKYTAIR
jgi:anaerobic magnesium-protoporphyrin IX monomethyl ester cyclase